MTPGPIERVEINPHPPEYTAPRPITDEEYQKLAPAERAVLIAKDVLARLNAYKFRTGSYLETIFLAPEDFSARLHAHYREAMTRNGKADEAEENIRNRVRYIDMGLDMELQPFADDLMQTCRVCLLGACFISKARVMDHTKAGRAVRLDGEAIDPDVHAQLLDAFDRVQSGMMETAFEHSTTYATRGGATNDEVRNAYLFTARVDDEQERVRMVMENVVANGGRFVPPEAYTVKYNGETGLFRQRANGEDGEPLWGPPDPATVRKCNSRPGNYAGESCEYLFPDDPIVTGWKPKE